MNIYKLVWLSALQAASESKKPDSMAGIWILISIMNSINYATIAIVLSWLDVNLFWAHYEIFGYYRFDGIINAFLNFNMPLFFLLSYFAFFKNDRYKRLLASMKINKAKLIASIYWIISMVSIVFVLFAY